MGVAPLSRQGLPQISLTFTTPGQMAYSIRKPSPYNIPVSYDFMKKRFRFVNFVSAVHTAILILSVVAISLYVLFVHYQDHIAGEARIQSETLSVNGDALRREVFSALSLIRNERKEYDALLRREIINRSHQGLELTQALYEKYKNRMGKKELKALLLNTLASHRFFEGKRGYYFVQGRDGYLYSSAGHPEAQGKHLSQIKNPVSVKMIENLLSLAQKSPEGFNDIRWFVPGESVFRPKLVYYTTFEPYGWYIGTGEYYSIIEKREQKKLLNRLSQIRFHKDSDGYIFIMHSDGTLLMHPFDPESIGKNVLEKTNAEGRKVFQEIQQLAQTQGSGFLTYSWLRPSVGQFEQKLTYVECDKEWNWIVGSGVYLNAIEQKVAAHQQRGRAKLNKEIFNILGATVLILTIFLTLNMVFRYFSGKDLAHFITFFNQAAASGNTIDSSRIRFKEFYVLSLQANRMLGAKKRRRKNWWNWPRWTV